MFAHSFLILEHDRIISSLSRAYPSPTLFPLPLPSLFFRRYYTTLRLLESLQTRAMDQRGGDHVKTYRPQLLLLCGEPEDRPHLAKLAVMLKEGNGVVLAAHVLLTVPGDDGDDDDEDKEADKEADLFANLNGEEEEEEEMKADPNTTGGGTGAVAAATAAEGASMGSTGGASVSLVATESQVEVMIETDPAMERGRGHKKTKSAQARAVVRATRGAVSRGAASCQAVEDARLRGNEYFYRNPAVWASGGRANAGVFFEVLSTEKGFGGQCGAGAVGMCGKVFRLCVFEVRLAVRFWEKWRTRYFLDLYTEPNGVRAGPSQLNFTCVLSY